MKTKFIIVGSGWRAAYYIRIAKMLPEQFEVLAVFCRTQEKADEISSKYAVHATISISECVALNPDFAVVAVSKSVITEVALSWLERGLTVLSETPAALDFETIDRLKKYSSQGAKLVIAEQYRLYPEYRAVLSLIKSGIIGEPSCLNISVAHEYHAASLIRAFLNIPVDMKFTVNAKTYEFPTTETLTRYESITDGRIALKKRTAATFEFENGKVAFYDFDSEQYRSPIRKNILKIQGVRGEVIDRKVYYLNEKNEARESELVVESRKVERDSDNPNFKCVEEIEKITFEGKKLYEASFGLCGLSQDETAIATLLQKTRDFAKGSAPSPYPLEEAIQDSYTAILMQEATRK